MTGGREALDGIDVAAMVRAVRARVRAATFLEAEGPGAATGARVLLVSETLQRTGSFKLRAATAAALGSTAPRLLTASSGNFGAALALAAREANKACAVVMPAGSSAVKIAAVRGFGAEVELVDTSRSSRAERLAEVARADPSAEVVSPYDDARVIAGNASLGVELFERERPDVVVVPVGGGGLASGLVVARELAGASGCEVVGAEPLLANDAARTLRDGVLRANEGEPPTLCDGARTPSLGALNHAILREGLAGIVEVPERDVVRALGLLFLRARLLVEPTGALAVAALLVEPARFAGRRVACVVSGANVEPALYARLLVEAAEA